MELKIPTCAADPRPGNTPYYIDPNCPVCGTQLELMDLVFPDPAVTPEGYWHDEFACRKCADGLCYMDLPPKEQAELEAAFADAEASAGDKW